MRSFPCASSPAKYSIALILGSCKDLHGVPLERGIRIPDMEILLGIVTECRFYLCPSEDYYRFPILTF